MTRRDYPGPGDGGARSTDRPPVAGWPIIFAAWIAVAAVTVIFVCSVVGR